MEIKERKKTALVVATHFPPNKRVGGVIRIAKFIKYLPENNWNSFVITAKSNELETFDNLLVDIESTNSVVYRLPSLDVRKPFQILFKFVNFLRGNFKRKKSLVNKNFISTVPISSLFFIPDHLIFWVFLASFKGIWLILFKKIDIIYTTSPMQSGLIVGLIIKSITKLPFIVELRDPWTTNPFYIKKKFKILDRLEEKLEMYTYLYADKIIVINEHFIPPILDKYPKVNKQKFVVIENGFDNDDFLNKTPKKFPKLTLVHSGNFYLGRSPKKFLEALAIVKNKHRHLAAIWDVVFVGGAEDFKPLIDDLEIGDFVSILGTVSHSDSISIMLGADALLLIPGKGKSTLTGKIYEYIATQKPIFVVSNESAAADLVNKLGIGIISNEENENQIADILVKFLIEFVPSYINDGNKKISFNQFERKNIVNKCVIEMNNLANKIK